jgi:hypothetical protein
MAPRFLERMQSQAAMQKKWNRNPHSGPPAYQHLDSRSSSETLPPYQPCPPPPAYSEHQHDESWSRINLQSFPQGSTVLVIGAYTRQGMHIIDRLLEHQYSVRGIVANVRESAQTAKHFEARHDRGRYQACIISDPTAEGAFDAAAKTCSGVVFVSNRSSPVTGSDVETLARVMSVLASAMREADMTRFVYCYPAAVADDFSTRMVDSTVSSTQEENASSRPPSYESSRNGSEQSRPETVPFSVEFTIGNWIGSNQPGFALDIGEFLHDVG